MLAPNSCACSAQPLRERTTATAIAYNAQIFGIAFGACTALIDIALSSCFSPASMLIYCLALQPDLHAVGG